MSSLIKLKDINKYYKVGKEKFHVLKSLNINIEEGDFVMIMGKSGSGKTTLLNVLAFLDKFDTGSYFFNYENVSNLNENQRSVFRNKYIGFIFQQFNLIETLSIYQNVELPLLYDGKLNKSERENIVKEKLEQVGLLDKIKSMPLQLSGGQQQRVALARALAVNPSVLLMDEPLSNLDAKLRLDMRQAIREIQHEVGITTVYVTHDQEEAMAISDQIAVMKDGVIQQIGRPKELYHKPANEFVATFIGRTNIIPANLEKRSDGAYIVFSDGYALRMPALDQAEEQAIHVSIRPEEFIKDESGDIEGTISDSVYLGLNTEYFIETGFASKIQVSEESTFEEDLQKGDRIRLRINTQKLNVFSADGSQNLIKGVNHGT